jgi:hypothetical protein
MRDELAKLTPVVRMLLAERFSEVEAVADVWLTLLCQPRQAGALLAATAIVQLAKLQGRKGPMASEPGS